MHGKDKELEDDDPMELVGMVIPADDDTMLEELGRTFADEFLRMGYPAHAIVALFRDPFYRAPHALFVKKGATFVRDMVEEIRLSRKR